MEAELKTQASWGRGFTFLSWSLFLAQAVHMCVMSSPAGGQGNFSHREIGRKLRVTSRLTASKLFGRAHYPVASSWVSVFMVWLPHSALLCLGQSGNSRGWLQGRRGMCGGPHGLQETAVLQPFLPSWGFHLHSRLTGAVSLYWRNTQGCLKASSWCLTKDIL